MSDGVSKDGFMKSPRQLEYDLFGPESPLPEKWRVFNFIKYRIQDNKRKSQAESISREYVIENTGIWPNHFARIISSLIKDNLIEVEKGNYRDSAATYRLSTKRFTYSVIVPDIEKKKKPPVDNSGSDVDKSDPENVDNTKMVSEEMAQHQNGVDQHQNDVETYASIAELLAKSPSRSLLPKAPENQNLRTPELGGQESGRVSLPRKRRRIQGTNTGYQRGNSKTSRWNGRSKRKDELSLKNG